MMAEKVKQNKQTEQNQPTQYTGRGGAAYMPRGAVYFLKTRLELLCSYLAVFYLQHLSCSSSQSSAYAQPYLWTRCKCLR